MLIIANIIVKIGIKKKIMYNEQIRFAIKKPA